VSGPPSFQTEGGWPGVPPPLLELLVKENGNIFRGSHKTLHPPPADPKGGLGPSLPGLKFDRLLWTPYVHGMFFLAPVGLGGGQKGAVGERGLTPLREYRETQDRRTDIFQNTSIINHQLDVGGVKHRIDVSGVLDVFDCISNQRLFAHENISLPRIHCPEMFVSGPCRCGPSPPSPPPQVSSNQVWVQVLSKQTNSNHFLQVRATVQTGGCDYLCMCIMCNMLCSGHTGQLQGMACPRVEGRWP